MLNMNPKTSHTPPCLNPIHATPCDMFCDGCLADCWEENKPFIVRAVNAHEELLETLKETYDALLNETTHSTSVWISQVRKRAQEAITKAEGK